MEGDNSSEVGQCGLCKRHATLVESHIIPKFVFRWLKETSITGYLRQGQSARRVQDGLKYRWLCRDCEDRFNKDETAFATKLFHPYNNDASVKVRYEEWLLKFCVSVSWRVLTHLERETGLKSWSDEQRVAAHAALESWRSFLFGEVAHPGRFEQHLLPLFSIESSTVQGLPNNMNRYLMRGADMDVPRGSKVSFVYTKMGRFALFGMVTHGTHKWEGSRVSPKGGIIQPGNYKFPRELIDYLGDRARKTSEITDSMPDHIHDKIEAAAMKDIDRLKNSDQIKAMLEDARMFGTEAVIRRPKSE